jgi:hypothetical protein
MANDPNQHYELLVQRLLQTKLRQDGLGTLVAFHRKKYKGKSGQNHEIDVSFEVKIGDLNILFCVECKHYTRKVGVDDAMAFAFRLQDIGANKGLIVTTAGFQAGTVTVARASRIALVIVAHGQIVDTWMGFIGQYFDAGLDNLKLYFSASQKELVLFGTRRIVCNETWKFTRLTSADHVTEVLDEWDCDITFLPPEQESRLDDTTDDCRRQQSIPQALLRNRSCTDAESYLMI